LPIISASRRTDIPAWHTDWFIDKIKRGQCNVANPFNGKVSQVSLKLEDVDGIVFWSRDYRPLIKHLPKLSDMGYSFYFQFTIIGYPKTFEPGSPSILDSTKTALKLAEMYGPHSVVWRYDPIILTSVTDDRWHIDNFRGLCKRLKGATDICVISFIDHYRKLDRNFYPALQNNAIDLYDPGWGRLEKLASELKQVAGRYGISVTSCCEPLLSADIVPPGPCIDTERLGLISSADLSGIKKNSTRKGCLCFSSKDIGAYDTCPTGCAYCYANHSRAKSVKSIKEIKPESLALIPSP
jgi:DNA repair photolyase